MPVSKIKQSILKLLFKRKFPYGYCDEWNWATCSSKSDTLPDGSILLKGAADCPYLKYNVPCWSKVEE
jgi:hypothetical protein